jgi:hypothetical protein
MAGPIQGTTRKNTFLLAVFLLKISCSNHICTSGFLKKTVSINPWFLLMLVTCFWFLGETKNKATQMSKFSFLPLVNPFSERVDQREKVEYDEILQHFEHKRITQRIIIK